MNFKRSNKPLLLVHRGMESLHNSAMVNIMLSPQFYTIKEATLPIKHLYQAKRLAPSILEELLVEDKIYRYHVYKSGDNWVFIAYDLESIEQFLQTKGVSASKVSKLFFAQEYAEEFSKPVLLNSNELLATINGTIVVLPQAVVDKNLHYSHFDSHINLKDGITFALNSGSLIGQKESIVLTLFFAIFATIFTVEGIRYKGVVDAMGEEIDTVLSNYPSLQSQYARDNIAKKYYKIDAVERHKRELLKSLSTLVISDVQIESLLFDSKKFVAIFRSETPRILVKIKSLAEAKEYKTSQLDGDKLIKVEGEL